MFTTLKNKLFGLSDEADLSISKLLFDFYLMIGANFVGNLYSKQLQTVLTENRYVQHLMGLMLMLSLVVASTKLQKQTSIFIFTLIAYILFTFSTKVDLGWNVAIMGLLFVSYLHEQKMTVKEKDASSDQALDEEDKKKIAKKNNFNRFVMITSIGIVVVIGTSMYLNKQKIQHGGNFDLCKYVFCGANA